MPDNVNITPGSGAVVAADDIGGALYQRMKLAIGADGMNDGDVSAANPLPTTSAPVQTLDAAATTSAMVVAARRRDADTSAVDTDGDVAPILVDETGRLKVSNYPGSQPATTGSITASAQTVSADVSRASNVMMYVTGTFAGHNCTFEGSIDGGTSWFIIQAVRSNANTVETATGALSAAPVYAWELSVNGLTTVRVRATAHTSGTANWRIQPAPYATEPIPAAQVSGTQPISGTVTASGTVGPAAHDAAISGNPLRIAGRALTANYTAVASGDVADLVTTINGALTQKPFSIPDLDWQFAVSAAITNTTDVALKAAVASVRNYITSFQFINTNATATEIVIKDGSTVIWRGFAPASMIGMVSVQLSTPLRGTANTAFNFACITTGASVYVSAQGYAAAA